MNILKSLHSVKDVVIEVKSEIFGVEWARSEQCPQPTYEGEIKSWKKKGEELYIKWPGYANNKSVPLEALRNDSEGGSLRLRLKDYKDGRPAPVLFVPPPARQGEQGPGDLEEQEEVEGAAEAGHTDEDDEEEAQTDEDSSDSDEAASEEGDSTGHDQDGEEEAEQENDGVPERVDESGQVWRLRDPKYVKTDSRTANRSKPSLNKGDLVIGSISEMFSFLVPDDWWNNQINHTNPKLIGTDSTNVKLTIGELKQWWGYCLALSLNPGVPIERAWAVTPLPNSVMPPMNMGRHGMTSKRWKKIRSVLSFGPADELSLTADHWAFVRPLVDSFNKCRAEKVTPGWLLGVDELMSAWRGVQGVLDPRKCPKISWVPRKPEPLGVENKATGDALSGMMLRVELCEGKEHHDKHKWFHEYGHTTATTLRITEPWHGSGRVVYGDSWFAGVKTAEAMLNNGLHFLGDVKTNTKRFCSAALDRATGPGSGDWAVYSSSLKLVGDETVPIYSVSHRRGGVVHKFIATCGTTLPGSSLKATFDDDEDRVSHSSDKLDYEVARKCPRVLNDCTTAQPVIDRHNRYRQFILAMEKRILTDRFALRFATTMHGILFTDAYFAYRYFNQPIADFREELSKLAYSLMHNPEVEAAREATPPKQPKRKNRTGRAASPNSGGVASESSDGKSHPLVKMKAMPGWVGGKDGRLNCIICNKKTLWCCLDCSEAPHAYMPLCPAQSNKHGTITVHECFEKHAFDPFWMPKGRAKTGGAKRRRTSVDDEEVDLDDAEDGCYGCESDYGDEDGSE